MSVPSIKKRLVYDFSMIPAIEELKDNEVFLVTPAGVITGYPVDPDNLGVVTKIAYAITNKYKAEAESPEDGPKPWDDGFIALRNVQFKTGDVIYNLEELLVFFDQIIGITFGQKKLVD